jgi:catechol 2,3-dioxygenase-like lactoylglutathione lyase family enzyme
MSDDAPRPVATGATARARMLDTRLVLVVRDLQASTAFYRDVLECQVVGGDPAVGWMFLSRDRFTVMLGECPDVTPATDIGDHSYVAYVVVDDVDQMHAALVRRGGAEVISHPTTESWGMREFGLRTPDGHRIRFGQDMN